MSDLILLKIWTSTTVLSRNVRNISNEGTILYAGVDYKMILDEAEKEADVIIWDGGNNDLPFFRPDLHITLVDSIRPMDEEHYYPGEANVRVADAILVTKVSDVDKAQEHSNHLASLTKAHAPVFFGRSMIKPESKGDRRAGLRARSRQACSRH